MANDLIIAAEPHTHVEACADHRSYARLGYGAVALTAGVFLAWSSLAPLDPAAIAPARIAVEGDRKPIQHLEGGIIQAILVKEAEHVEAGQVLFRLDTTKARSTAETLRSQLTAARAQESRLAAEAEGSATLAGPTGGAADPLASEGFAASDQRRIFAERRRTLQLQIATLAAKTRQAEEDIASRGSRLEASRRQVESLDDDLATVADAAKRGYYPRNKLRALERDRFRAQGEVGAAESDIARVRQAIEEQRQQMLQAEQKLREDAGVALADVRGRIADLTERLAVAEDTLSRVDLRAPYAGIIIGVNVKTPGAVVQPGATLAEVVPAGTRLALSAKVSPLDIHAVAVGQKAEVRFPALASRNMPPVFGHVETVSADSVFDDKTRETYFAAQIVVDPSDIPNGMGGTLVPGTPADTLIITGERSLLAYIVGPLKDRLAKGMRES